MHGLYSNEQLKEHTSMLAKSIYRDTLTNLFSDLTPGKLAKMRDLNYFCDMQHRYYGK